MSDATLYRIGDDELLPVATVEAVTGYDLGRPMLGTIHEAPAAYDQGVHRQALPFGSREGVLELALVGDDAATRALALDDALRLNAAYQLDMPHFAPLHGMRWAVAGEYRLTYRPDRARRTWVVTIPIKELR